MIATRQSVQAGVMGFSALLAWGVIPIPAYAQIAAEAREQSGNPARALTRVERALDRANAAVARAGSFVCTGGRGAHARVHEARGRYDRLYDEVAQRIQGTPSTRIIVADCVVSDTVEFARAIDRANDRLRHLERLLREKGSD